MHNIPQDNLFSKSNLSKLIFYVTLFLFCIAMSMVVNTPDYDLWSRLIVGKSILESGHILTKDFLSYTPTHFWYDHEWGSGLIFYSVYKYFGDIGLVILKGSLIFFIIYFISQIIKLRTVKTTTPYNIIFYIFVFLASYNVLSSTIRCHLFTFLFFAIWLYLLERVRIGEKKWLYLLPVTMVIWCNIHGGCVSGIGLLAIYILGEFLNKKPVKDYIISFVLSCLALFINPYGPKYVLFLIKATTMPRPFITEWKSTFHPRYANSYLRFKFFLLVMLLTIALKSIREKIDFNNIDKTKALLLGVTAILSIQHIKHQPFFVIAAAAFLYDDFYTIYNSLITGIRKKNNITSDIFIKYFVSLKEILVYGSILLVCLVTFTMTTPVIKISQALYPIYPIEFVKINNLKGNLFIGFEFAGYAGYKLYPDNLIAIDGRYEEVYYDDLLESTKRFHLVETKNWDEVIKKYKTDIIILEKSYPAYKKMFQNKRWSLIFDDKYFGVFIPSDKVKKTYKYPSASDDYYDKTKFNTNMEFNNN